MIDPYPSHAIFPLNLEKNRKSFLHTKHVIELSVEWQMV